MRVPPEGRSVVGVKANVTGIEVLPEMRSVEAMVNDTDATRPNMLPDATAVDATVSDDVCTVTPVAPEVTVPIVIPVIVTVKTDAAEMSAPDIVITTDVAVVAPNAAVSPATLLPPAVTLLGVTDGAKKPVG
jgi:hypothetical protein